MRHRGTMAAVGALAALLGWACAEPRPVPASPPPAALAGVDAWIPPAPEPVPAAPEDLDAGGAVDAASPPEVKWTLVDSGRDENGEVQPCDAKAGFASLASVLAKPVPGPVAVRGRVWTPAAYPCTAGLPEACFATPVLAKAKPVDGTEKQVFLLGYLAPYRQLACAGQRQKLRCPIPVDGREYGVTGTLRTGGYADAPTYEIEVQRICRFAKGAGR